MDASPTDLVAHALLLTGAALMVAALVPLRRIIGHLPAGHSPRTWYGLAAFDLAFIAAYLVYAVRTWNAHDSAGALLVPAVFFSGGCFVLLTFRIALHTMRDVQRVARLEQESITDHLTGAYNRRYLDRRLDEEFARARRHVQPLSVLMVDLDGFGSINDTLGHAIGDLALGHVGALTLKTARATDIVARYGGDELLVIAPNTPPSQALVLAERLRRCVEAQPLSFDGPTGPGALALTASIGVAAIEWDMAETTQLIEAADRALYSAKRGGRNRVAIDRGGYAPAPTLAPAPRGALTAAA